jgi:hypothetical protein
MTLRQRWLGSFSSLISKKSLKARYSPTRNLAQAGSLGHLQKALDACIVTTLTPTPRALQDMFGNIMETRLDSRSTALNVAVSGRLVR